MAVPLYQIGLLLLILLTVSCTQVQTSNIPNPTKPPQYKEWHSRWSQENSQRALELGYQDLWVTCAAQKGTPQYIYIRGQPEIQLIKKTRRSLGKYGYTTSYINTPLRIYLKPGDYWKGLDPIQEFCPEFNFDWQNK